MFIYFISEVKKRTKSGGKGICQVFSVNLNWKKELVDITEQIAKRRDFEYKKNSITINYWSGTWFDRIKTKFLEKDKKTKVYNTSVFAV